MYEIFNEYFVTYVTTWTLKCLWPRSAKHGSAELKTGGVEGGKEVNSKF